MNSSKRKNRIILFILPVGLLCVFLISLLNTIVIAQAEHYILEPSQIKNFDADCVLVLGARVYSSGSPSLILKDRLERGVELYNCGGSAKLLLSGDHGTKSYDEVNAMKQYAMKLDVPLEDIFLDHAGFSTYDSMYRARDVFNAKKIIIVTQEFHIYRAVYVARKLGLDAVGISSDIHQYYFETELKNAFREQFARAKDWFYVNIVHPFPKYLGEKIDITGSGTVTHD